MKDKFIKVIGCDLEIKDIVKVDFTDAYCEVISKNSNYSRVSITLSYYDQYSDSDISTIISGHKEVLKQIKK